MVAKYNHQKIEKKWQAVWEKKKLYRAQYPSTKKKYYTLIEFPYPSGDGLHVGHVRSYTAMDIVARKRRMEGYNVLYPIGWDAFGLPTENYAIKIKTHPKIVTKKNTDNFRRQLKLLGFSFDWDREINTTDPEYYKWTQWLFLRFFEAGLAYKAKTEINWCPKDKIGLANEEVAGGVCERCGTEVKKREKEQWMLKITAYAEKLLSSLEGVNYIPEVKRQQENWIGKSEGTEIEFRIKNLEFRIKVFTTRADTLFGATYLVLAPEHELVKKLESRIKNLEEVKKYIVEAKQKTDIERTAENKEKTGVELRGVKAVNPANKEDIPIWISDYVLAGYGTGAIMAVPAHDDRDKQFAIKYRLPIKQVVAPYTVVTGQDAPRSDENIVHFDAATAIIKHWKEPDLYYMVEFTENYHGLVGGHVEDGECSEDAVCREVTEESGYSDIKNVTLLLEYAYSRGYKTRKTREELCRDSIYVVELASNRRVEIVDHETKKGMWMSAKDILKLASFVTHHRVYFEHHYLDKAYVGEGKLVNSGLLDGLDSEEAKKKITEFVGGKITTQYKLRDWVFSRQRYWGEPIPLVYCENCVKTKKSGSKGESINPGWIPVIEKDLPVTLPNVKKYMPTDTGESPLANIKSWVETTCPRCKGKARRETDVMPNWAGSSWYFLRYTDPENKKAFADSKKLKYWTPVDWYNGGMEHTVLHLLYSRFWNQFLHDLKLVPTAEPYKKRTSHGLILGKGGVKMSKSKGNVVNPDEVVRQFGADALRLYEMFIGPFNQHVAWDPHGIVGTRRFLERVWKFVYSTHEGKTARLKKKEDHGKLDALMHKTIKKVSEDIESLRLNTAVSALMILLNEMEAQTDEVTTQHMKTFLQLLAPFAPHIAEELWEGMGEKSASWRSIHIARWPAYDERVAKEETFSLVVQLNGKVRIVMEAPVGISQEEAEKLALSQERVIKALDGKKLARIIYVPGKLINFVL